MRTSPGGPITNQQFASVSADETLGPWIDVRGCQAVAFALQSSGTTSSGVITIEEASVDFSINPLPMNAPVFGATTDSYSAVTTINASDVSGGKQKITHLAIAAYGFVRARISTAIGGGGTVSGGFIAY